MGGADDEEVLEAEVDEELLLEDEDDELLGDVLLDDELLEDELGGELLLEDEDELLGGALLDDELLEDELLGGALLDEELLEDELLGAGVLDEELLDDELLLEEELGMPLLPPQLARFVTDSLSMPKLPRNPSADLEPPLLVSAKSGGVIPCCPGGTINHCVAFFFRHLPISANSVERGLLFSPGPLCEGSGSPCHQQTSSCESRHDRIPKTARIASVARDRLFMSVHTYRIVRRGNASHSRAFAGSVTAVFWSESVVSFFSDFRFAIPVSVTPV